MAEGSISTSDLSSYVLDGLFESFGRRHRMMITFETKMLVNFSNETVRDGRIIYNRYTDIMI